jgi:hypothetical protein
VVGVTTNVEGGVRQIAGIELLGFSFAERRSALQQVDSYRGAVRQALADSVRLQVGQEVDAVFRPSSATIRRYPRVWVPCYRIEDTQRTPREERVLLKGMSDDGEHVFLAAGELADGMYDAEYSVGLLNILDIQPVTTQIGETAIE